MNAKGHSARKSVKPTIWALEPRLMFDGAAVADAAAAADAAAKAAVKAAPAPVTVREADPSKDNGKKEVAFVDTSVANYKTLEAGIKEGVAIVEIGGGASGLAQMAQWAETHSGYDAIHVMSHGAAGVIALGTDRITDANLSDATTKAELEMVGKALTADGDLMIYGCDVGKGDAGQKFLTDLATVTGADVAASDDTTGAASTGGDWALERQSGQIEAAALVADHYGDKLQSGTAGQIDTSFGTTAYVDVDPVTATSQGRVVYSYTSGANSGKFLVAVRPIAVDSNVYVYRYNADGSLDTGFGTNGQARITADFGNMVGDFVATVDTSGKIVLAGRCMNASTTAWNMVFRLNNNGSLDTSFDSDGRAYFQLASGNINIRGFDFVQSLADGSILLVGRDQNLISSVHYDHGFVMKLNSAGALDTSFGNGGYFWLAKSHTTRPNGLVVSGNSFFVSYCELSPFKTYVAKFSLATGALDTSFGSGGEGVYTPSGGDAQAWDSSGMVAQSDGKLVIVLNNQPGGSQSLGTTRLIRFGTDGTLDTSFGINGKADVDLLPGQAELNNTIAVQADDKLLVTSQSCQRVARLNANGSLDATFGTAGIKEIHFPHAAITAVSGVHVTGDGGILLDTVLIDGGKTNTAVVRLFQQEQTGAMALNFVTSTQTSSPVPLSYFSNVLKVVVGTNGEAAALSASSFTFSTAGTDDVADLGAATLAYTGDTDVFSLATRLGTTVKTPNGTFTFTGVQTLSTEFSIFWLAYQPTASAMVGHAVDAQVSSITINGVAHTPLVTSPDGTKAIFNELPAKFYSSDEWLTSNLSRYDIGGGSAAAISDSTNGDPYFNSVAIDVNSQRMFLSDYSKLYVANVWGDSRSVLLDTGDVQSALGVDSTRGKLFYFRSNNLYWMNVDGTGAQEILINGNQHVSDFIGMNQTMEVDSATGTLYFLGNDLSPNGGKTSIFKVTYGDASNSLTQIAVTTGSSGGNNSFYGFGLDPDNGKIYVSYKNAPSDFVIKSMNTDGTGVATLYSSTDPFEITDMYFVPGSGYLYWSTSGGDIYKTEVANPTNTVIDFTAGTNGANMASQNLAYKRLETAPLYAPDAPLLDAADDSGVAGDNITSVAAPRLRVGIVGTNAVIGDTLQVLLAGNPLANDLSVTLTSTDLANGYVDFAITSGDLGADGSKALTAKLSRADASANAVSNAAAIMLDRTAPVINASTPADNATGVSSSANIVLNFDGGMVKGTGNVVIKRVSDNATIETIDVTSGLVTINGSQVTINPNTTLAGGVAYYVLMDNGALKDAAGNVFGGISSTTALNFTTLDTTAPTLQSMSPADDATNVMPSADIVLTFDEPIAKGTGNIVIKRVSDNAVIETIDVTSNLVTISGTQATINPNTTLALSTGYYVTVDNGAFQDTSGNVYAGISSTTALNFTTAATVGPTTTITSASLLADTGSSSTDWLTKTAAQTVSGNLSTALTAGQSVEVSFDNGGSWHTTSATTGDTAFSYVTTLSGSDTFQARVKDSTGTGTAYTHAYTLDTTAPTVSAVSVPNATMKVGDTVTVSLTVGDDGSTAYTLGTSSIGGFALSNLTRIDNTHYTAQFTVSNGGADVAAGSDIPVSIVLTDAAGNSNTAYTTAIAQAGDAIDANRPVVTAVSIPNTTMKVGDTVTATITVASDADTLTLASGSIGDFALSNLQKVNATTYTAQFTVTNGGTDVAAGSNVPVSLVLTDAAGNSNTAYTTAVAQAGDAIDANRPVVTAVSIPNTSMKVGDTVTATITVASDADTLALASGSIGGFALSNLQKVNATTYTAQFTVTNGGTDVAAGSNVPVSLVLTDAAGNASTAFTTAIAQAGDRIDANKPVISNVTLDATHYKIGDTVTATITTASDTDIGYSIATATIGGHTLGNLTRVNATTWTASYTVQNGDSDMFAGNPAVNIVLTDSAGNQSSAYTTAIAAATTIGGHAPTDIGLTSTSSALTAGSTIGTLSATDTNAGSETFTYSLPAGVGDNNSFAISGTTLKVGAGAITAGTYAVTVRVTDAGGNTFDKQFTITAANIPAVTSVNRAGAQVTKGAGGLDYTVTFNQGVEGVDASDFSVVRGAGVTGTAVVTVTAGNDGDSTYTVHVAGLGGDGTVELDLNGTGTGIVAASDHTTAILAGSSGGQTYTLDNTAPAAPTGLTISDDTGSSSTDGITTDNTLTIGGNAEPGADIEVFKDGVSIGHATANGSGAWSFDYTGTTLGQGDYGFTAKATDAAGNVSAASAAKSVTVDTTAPNAPSTPDLAAGSDTGADNADNMTTVTTPTFTGTAEAGATVRLYDTDGVTVIGTGTADGSGNWSITTSALGLGAHTITAKVTDAAGNTSTVSTGLGMQVVTAPTAPTGLTISDDTGLSNTDGQTSTTTQTISGTAPANATVLVFRDGVAIGTTIADGAGVWSFDHTGTSLAQGTHVFTAVARVNGQDSVASPALNVTIDTTAPAAPMVTGIGNDDGSSASDGLTTNTTLVITGTAEANSTVEVFKNGVSIGTATANGSGAWSFDYTGTSLALGSYVFTAKATDAAGNQSAASAGFTARITTDSTIPAAPAMTVSGGGASTTVSVTGTAEANATVTIYDGATVLGRVTANGAGTWTYNATLAVGNHILTATATDAVGNISAVSGAATVTINPPPVLSAPVPPPPPPPTAPSTSPAASAPVITAPPVDSGSAGLVTAVREASRPTGTGDTQGTGGLAAVIQSQPSAQMAATGPAVVQTIPAALTASAPQAFQVAVAVRPAGGGDALLVNAPIRDTVVAEGTRLSVTLPAEAFAHTKSDATVTLTATRADGAALPGWMSFNPATGTFEGRPPPNFRGEVVVKVVARDKDGRQAVQTFKIVVGRDQGNLAPARGEGGGLPGERQGRPQGAPERSGDAGQRSGGDAGRDGQPAGRASLTQQLYESSQEGRVAKQAAFLNALKRGGKAA